jgi:hypothetical protein
MICLKHVCLESVIAVVSVSCPNSSSSADHRRATITSVDMEFDPVTLWFVLISAIITV